MPALPIVSHSPGPGGDSCGRLPPDQGEITPDKKTNPYPPPPWGGGWAEKQRLAPSKVKTVPSLPLRGWGGWAARLRHNPACLGRGEGSFLPAHSPEPPGPAQTLLSWVRHKRSRGSDTANHRHTPPRHSQPLLPPPPHPTRHTRGWVGGRTENCLKKKGKQLLLVKNKGLPRREGTHSTKH